MTMQYMCSKCNSQEQKLSDNYQYPVIQAEYWHSLQNKIIYVLHVHLYMYVDRIYMYTINDLLWSITGKIMYTCNATGIHFTIKLELGNNHS